jgi:SAM-dependent methyltransferase
MYEKVRFSARLLLVVVFALACSPKPREPATRTAETSQPSRSQPEPSRPEPLRKPDVPYEPSSPEAIEAMLRLAKPGPTDVVYDLGCGDGRVVIEAVKRSGARGVCVDIDPVRVKEARENAERTGVAVRMTFRNEDLFETDIADASLVLLFLWPEINLRLLPRLLRELRPGTRIVSNMHDMGDFAPEASEQVTAAATGRTHPVYLWRVPERR